MKHAQFFENSSPSPWTAPVAVRPIRVLGHGRAAEAVLVDATMPDGQTRRCVEKVFAAGWLTRTIYRLSFQAPFAYQTNRDAILACFYRRRVAAAVLEASETSVRVANPLYVRYDEDRGAWVLAAEWIDGRGIRPAAANRHRLRSRWFGGKRQASDDESCGQPEVHTLVETMRTLEDLFAGCGLIGSGWQVAPRAMVSTANLLRQRDHYTIIDLESGIPAVLVPKYLLRGARRASLPPFDDLDSQQLRNWAEQNQRLLYFRLGMAKTEALRADIEKLIEHSERWKESELALLRRPWRLLRRSGMAAYQQECIRRWEQDGTADPISAHALASRPWKSRLIWYAGLFPGAMGRLASKSIGNVCFRHHLSRMLRSRSYRHEAFENLVRDRQQRWIESGRLAPATELSTSTFLLHQLLQAVTPRPLHRFLCDRSRRRTWLAQGLLLMLSPRYQAHFGYRKIESAIESWRRAERISAEEAEFLRQQLSAREVNTYVRGFGAHLALKMLTPIVASAKYGGLAAFIASGNIWFLLPMLVMPTARSLVTLASWWSSREEGIPHGEALLAGLLPVVGSVAFPLQMFAARSELSTFLIRDTASKLGRRVPIYGGPNSRTEIAMIRSTDTLVEILDVLSGLTQTIRRQEDRLPISRDHTTEVIPLRRGRIRWIDQLAIQQIAAQRRKHERQDDESASEHLSDDQLAA